MFLLFLCAHKSSVFFSSVFFIFFSSFFSVLAVDMKMQVLHFNPEAMNNNNGNMNNGNMNNGNMNFQVSDQQLSDLEVRKR